MAEYSSFFKSIAGDKKYSADKFAEYFRAFLTSGILNGGTTLQVEQQTPAAMGIKVAIGKAWIQGYYYDNSASKPLTIDAAHITYDRIDRIVARLDVSDSVRSITTQVLKGTPAGSPVAPTLTTDFSVSGIYELSLAQILVTAGATTITTAKITDERLGIYCGIVNSLITLDTATFEAEWDAFMLLIDAAWHDWFDNTGGIQDDWQAWFDAIQLVQPLSTQLMSDYTDKRFCTDLEKSNYNVLSTHGDILFRGATAYERLPAGTPGQILQTNGVNQNPVWGNISEQITTAIVASGKSVTANSVVEMINGGIQDATTTENSLGTKYNFNTHSVGGIVATVVSASKILITYYDISNSDYGTAVILNIDGSDNITKGTEFVFSTAATYDMSIVTLTSTKFLVAYRNSGNASKGTAVILNIDGSDNISKGTALVFHNAAIGNLVAVVLTSTKALVYYQDASQASRATAIVLNVSTNTITAATAAVLASVQGAQSPDAKLISSLKVLICGGYNNTTGKSSVLTVDGSDNITESTALEVVSAQVNYTKLAYLSSGKYVMTYATTGGTLQGTAVVLNIDGSNNITKGTAYVFSTDKVYNIFSCSLTSDKVVIVYMSDDTTYKIKNVTLNISSDIITKGVIQEIATEIHSNVCAVPLSTNKIITVYKRATAISTYYQGAAVLNVSLDTPKNVLGVSKETKTSGQTASISYGMEIAGFSGLTQGAYYYLKDDGTLNSTAGTITNKMAIAISTTKIKWLNPII